MQTLINTNKRSRLPAAVLAALLLAGTARAQTGIDVSNTTNYGNASWGVGTGTSAFLVAGPYNAVTGTATDYFYNTGSNIEIAGTTAPAFYNLVFDNGTSRAAAITNTAGIDVANNLQLLNGSTTTAYVPASAIRLGASATLAGSISGRYVDGYLAKAGAPSFIYEVGGSGFYAPAIFSNPAGSNLRYVHADQGNTTSLSTTQGADNLASVSNAEYYALASSATPAGSTVEMGFAIGGRSGALAIPNMTIAGYDGTLNQWVNLATGGPTNMTLSGLYNGTITVTLNRSLSGITALALGNSKSGVLVSPSAFLQGPYTGSSMATILNSKGVLPLLQPYNIAPFGIAGSGYAGSETVAAGFFVTHTNIVDWILVELRNQTTPATIVAVRAAFLLSNGHIVDLDGTSPVSFEGIPANDYYVSLRHRNHLGVRSSAKLSLSSTTTAYDFSTAAAQANGTDAMTDMGGVFALWAGNVNGDDRILDIASPSDPDGVSADVLFDPDNLLFDASFVGSDKYSVFDINMDGKVLDISAPSDADIIRSNVLFYPGNILFDASSILLIQALP